MKKMGGGWIWLAFVAIVVAPLVLLADSDNQRAKETRETVVSGTGSFVTDVMRTTEPLDPPCVTLLTRSGNVAFSGLIENALEDGRQEVRGLRDACAEPVEGTAKTTFTLANATVAGRTGGLILDAVGYFVGDATGPAGARPQYHFTIRGISGELRGATGVGQSVGQATTVTAFDTYYAEIVLPDRGRSANE